MVDKTILFSGFVFLISIAYIFFGKNPTVRTPLPTISLFIATPTSTNTVISTPTTTPPPTYTPTPTVTRTPTNIPANGLDLPTPTATTTDTPTATPTSTLTSTPTSTPGDVVQLTSLPKPIPTDTPTSRPLTPTPTSTATPTRLPALTLLKPADQAVFGPNDPIKLEWSDAPLADDEYYFVDVTFYSDTACDTPWLYWKWTKEPHHVIDGWLHNTMCNTKRELIWTVYVAIPDKADLSTSTGKLRSEKTPSRVLIWYTAGGGDGSSTTTGGGGNTTPDGSGGNPRPE